MITVSIDERQVKLPTRWSEVSYKIYVQLAEKGRDLIGQIALLTGVSEQTWRTAKFNEGIDHIFNATRFLNQMPLPVKYPTVCGPYVLGRNIETMAQLNAITEQCEISAQSKDMRSKLQCLANIAAIYCQGIGETFDKEKALYIGQTIQDLPCEEVLAAGNYYMTKALSIISKRPQDEFRKDAVFAESKEPFFKRLWHSLL